MSQQLNRFYKLSTGLYLGRENSRVRGKLSTRTKLDHQHEPNYSPGCGREEFLIFWYQHQDEAQTGGQERPVSYDLLLIKLLYLAWRCNENIHCQSVSRPIYLTVYCTILCYIFLPPGCQHHHNHLCSSPVPGGPGRSQQPQHWDFSRVLALNRGTSPLLTPHNMTGSHTPDTTLILTTCVWWLVSNK